MLEHAQQRLIQTIKRKEGRYVVYNWIIYARLSVFDSYRDTIVIVISKLLSIVIVIVLALQIVELSSVHWIQK